MENIRKALEQVDWTLLARQKQRLLNIIGDDGNEEIACGVIHFLDSLQDAAARDGFPVIFLGGDPDDPDDPADCCDECEATIPGTERNMMNRFHRESCSLHPDNCV